MKPWKREDARTTSGSTCPYFNGATAMKPWKRAERAAVQIGKLVLQWGHGDEAVEEQDLGEAAPAHRIASMGPRR